MNNPSPQRVQVLTFLTARQDILFYEKVNLKTQVNVDQKIDSPHWDKIKYPNHRLVYKKALDSGGEWYMFYYAADRDSQDEYNWEWTEYSIGIGKFKAISRTYVTRRSSFDPQSPAIGAIMPNVPLDKFSGEFILAERSSHKIDPEFDSLYVVEQRVYVQRIQMVKNTYDEMFGQNLLTKQFLLYFGELVSSASTIPLPAGSDGGTPAIPKTIENVILDGINTYWGMQGAGDYAGFFRSGEAISSFWYVITERQAVPAFMLSSGRSYETTIDGMTWPAVLEHLQIDAWVRHDGGTDDIATPLYKRARYSGPCKALIEETFHTDIPSRSVCQSMLPLPIHISSPIFSVGIPDCLYGSGWTENITTGTHSPTYIYTGASFTFKDTNLVSDDGTHSVISDWPDSILISSIVSPFRGGYLKKNMIVYSPKEIV